MLKQETEAFERLLKIMQTLRKQCPWDRKQTLESLRHLTIEETYELSDAILSRDMEEVKKELGDLLLHIVFYSQIGEEEQAFTTKDVIDGICEKLIRRHPHIYGNTEVKDDQDVKNNWEKIKLQEGQKSALSGVPNSLPAMIKAYRMQEKARGIGFDWDNADQVIEKVKEEWSELHEELKEGIENNHTKIESEFGDLLFALINWARFIGVNPEDALEHTNRKFKSRFQYMEQQSNKTGKDLNNMTLEEMDVWWEEAKSKETNSL